MNEKNNNMQFDSELLNERPLVTLIPKKNLHWLGAILVVSITLFNIFAVIIPVLKSGDYSSVWPVSDKRTGVKTILFYMAWGWLFYLPACLPAFRKGLFCFYENRLEVKPFFVKKIRTFYYKEMSVTLHGNYRMTINKHNVKRHMTLLQRLKNKYWDGVAIGLLHHGLKNHEDVETVISILKDKAATFNVKTLS
ncbi:MAG: hypothetical protein OEY01_16735 [Desulfobulbaceae bacterium]|nr:hypothetical protein [Desulfobulbaceae bacterium]